MKVNTNNSNFNFQNFNKCNYNKHWSYSNFFRHLFVCNELNTLKDTAIVIELGAANSNYEQYMHNNFIKKINIKKYDYKESRGVKKLDITKKLPFKTNSVDCIILTEVIEHLTKKDGEKVLAEIHRVLVSKKGLLLFTTPTPNKLVEDRVWPEDHDFEYSLAEISSLLNKHFKINKEMPWSMTEKEYRETLKTNIFIQNIYCKLKDSLPEGLIRALISIVCNPNKSRQIAMSCTKRTIKNEV